MTVRFLNSAAMTEKFHFHHVTVLTKLEHKSFMDYEIVFSFAPS